MIEMYIDKRSHHFRVYNFTRRGNDTIREFARKLIQWGYVRERGGFRKAPLKTFAASNHKQDEYRFHINQFDEFISFLKNKGIYESSYVVYEVPLREVEKVELPVFSKWVPRDYQLPPIDYIVNDGPVQKLICLQTGLGKAQPLDASIHTPDGWSTMGEMYVGKKIYTQSGKVTEVTGVYPQGCIDTYYITFSDGRSTRCCGDHLWKVFNWEWPEGSRDRVLDTKTIKEHIKENRFTNKLYIPLPEHPDVEDKVFVVSPYDMGVQLGHSFKCQRDRLKPKVALYDTIVDFIPKEYFESSKAQKIDLLRGVLDVDGQVGERGIIHYRTYSGTMAVKMQHLIRSIGGWCKNDKEECYLPSGGPDDGSTKVVINNLSIQYNTPEDLFTLPEKKALATLLNTDKDIVRLSIEEIRYNGKQESQCISIKDGSRLYITDEYIVTHNTFISMYATSQLKHRLVLVAKPMYLDKWVLDVEKTYDIPKEDIIVVRGGASLMALIAKCREGNLTEKVILLSNKTLLNFIKNFERFGVGIEDMGYDATPDELFQLLGGGIRVIDEVHQDFHFNFKLDLYTHTERSVSLSATMLSDDPFIKQMYQVAYPKNATYEGEDAKPYINTFAVMYSFKDSKKIKYTDYSGKTYSHHVFEQSIIKDKVILTNYLKMIGDHVDEYFVKDKEYKKGDKFIVFCASIDMCTRVTNYLQERFPQFNIARYVEDDPYENLMEPDGRVSTLLSAGTAVDIDQLTRTFLTTAVNSSVSNVQGFGRLRQLKDKRNPLFAYFNDMNNSKHMDYHSKKKEIILPRSLNFKELNYGSAL